MTIHLYSYYLHISWKVDKPVQFVARGRFFQNGRQILQNVLLQYQIAFSKHFCLINDRLLIWSLSKGYLSNICTSLTTLQSVPFSKMAAKMQ